ncbi:MAG: biotin/lipoate A/B protein ligase family protein [Myxococcota bacterium]
MGRPWRLLVDANASGHFNMGVDEALLSSAILAGTPSLRFYGWTGPWLSLGYAQPLEPEQVRQLEAAGVGWVRRVTGGRAVLHGADLTYSIAAPEDALPAGLRASYGVVADALLEALQSLGVLATRSHPGASAPGVSVFDCFQEPAADEICLAGKKLSGSAQRRVGRALLQHGSIRLAPDPPDAVHAVAPGRRSLGGTSLAEAGATVSREALEGACARAFSRRLGVPLEPSPLSAAEVARARSRGPEPPRSGRYEGADSPEMPADSWAGAPQESPSSIR